MPNHVQVAPDLALIEELPRGTSILHISRDGAGWVIVYRDAECDGCGEPLAECTSPRNERRYRARIPTRCHACTAISKRRVEYAHSPVSEALAFTAELGEVTF